MQRVLPLPLAQRKRSTRPRVSSLTCSQTPRPDTSANQLPNKLTHEPALQWMQQEENHHCHSKEVTLQQQRFGGEAILQPQACQQEAQVQQTPEEEVMWPSQGLGGACHASPILFSVFVDFSS